LDIAGKRAFLTTELLLLAVHDDEMRIEPALLEGLQRGHTVSVVVRRHADIGHAPSAPNGRS
jgi:hypothetical protein